jgi:type II secretory pathway component GspD/PulD (secretin)
VVSYDKKYVTLEVIPSLVEFIDYRGGGLTTISEDPPLRLQLPWIEAQQINATIITPDRGTVVLAGFKDIFTRHLKSDVPLLGDIPIISFLFGRRAKATENRRLYILITPYILDLPELIKKFAD